MQGDEREMCDMGISPQHQLVALYNNIVSTEIQGLASIAFCLSWKKNRERKKTEQDKYPKLIEEYLKKIKE